jgi:mersacidin/lichenicidin family type 2 lantibiotic
MKTTEEVIRVWTDQEFRSSMSATELAKFPEHPSGRVQIDQRILRLGSFPDGAEPVRAAPYSRATCSTYSVCVVCSTACSLYTKHPCCC